MMGIVQLLYLAYAGVRVEGAAWAVARSAIALGDTDPNPAVRLKTSAALMLVPVSPGLTSALARGGGIMNNVAQALNSLKQALQGVPLLGNLVAGVDRFFYAYRYTRVCQESVEYSAEDPYAPLRLTLRVEFRAPLLLPIVGGFLGERDDELSGQEKFKWQDEWSSRGDPSESPLFKNLSELQPVAGALANLTSFSSIPKRTLRASYPVFLYRSSPVFLNRVPRC